jgi:hypothetical protein
MLTGQRRLREAGRDGGLKEIESLLERIQKRRFDDAESPGRRTVDAAIGEIMRARAPSLEAAQMSAEQRDTLTDVMRRFLRVSTTLIRCFPIRRTGFGRGKFDGFIDLLTERCSSGERMLCLEAASRTQAGGIRVESDEDEDASFQYSVFPGHPGLQPGHGGGRRPSAILPPCHSPRSRMDPAPSSSEPAYRSTGMQGRRTPDDRCASPIPGRSPDERQFRVNVRSGAVVPCCDGAG